MKKMAFLIFFGVLGVSFWLAQQLETASKPTTNKTTLLAEEPAAIGTPDDPDARERYERLRLQDPATGQIPAQIRKRELDFAATLPTKESLTAQLRKAGVTSAIQTATWSSRGPLNIGGRTRALAVDVSNTNLILAGGVSGGMWRSTNGGTTWTKTTAASALHSVTCVAQDTRPGKTGIWYYGTGEYRGNSASGSSASSYRGDGIFKSTDGGASWTQLPATVTDKPQAFDQMFDYVWTIATDPSNLAQDEVYAAAYGGILRSPDGGNNWTTVLGGFGNTAGYTDVAVTSTGVVYATLNSDGALKGIWRSPDGVNWTSITPPGWPSYYGRIVIGVSTSNANTVYFLAETSGSGLNGHSLWKYTYVSGNGAGAGGTWVNRSANLPAFGGLTGNFNSQGSYDLVIKVKPDDENVVFIGGTNLYRSTDGFATTANTKWIGGYDSANTDYSRYPNHHPDQHALAFSPASSTTLFSGHDGGISKTTDALATAVTWTSLSGGYMTSQFYTVAIDHATSENNIIIGGLQDNGTWFTNSNLASPPWIELMGGDGAFCAIADGRTSYYGSFQNGVVYRLLTNDAGAYTQWTRVDPTRGVNAPPYLFINPFVLDSHNSNRMYLAGGDRIWRNDNLTAIPLFSNNTTSVNWTALVNSGVSNTVITALAVSKSPPNRLYYGTSNGRLFRLDGAHLGDPPRLDVWTGQGFPASAYVSCIAVDPANADRVIAVFSNYNVISLFYTANGGTSWTPVAGNLEQNPDGSGNGPSCRWVAILPNGNATQYLVGTSTGLYSTTNLNGAGTVWEQEGASTIGNVVVDMIDTRHSDLLAVVGTHGQGVFSANFPAGNINVPSPSAGVTWLAGSQQTVSWSTDGLIGAVHLKLSTDGGTTFPITLASNRPNDGIDTVNVPLVSSGNCRVRVESVTAPSITGVNAGNFTIASQGAPAITVTAPAAGAIWKTGTRQLITWTTNGVANNVHLKLSTDNGLTFPTTLASDVPNLGAKTIIVPNTPSTKCQVRVESATNSSLYGKNPGNFTIKSNPITWQVNLNVRDSGNRKATLSFGQGDKLTDGLDAQAGETELFPMPPSGVFDARFELPVAPAIAALKDFRNDSAVTPRWRVRFQPGTTGPLYFSWNPADFPAGSFFLRDEINGTLVNVDMKVDTSYVLTNNALLSLRIGPPETLLCREVNTNNGWNLISLPVAKPDMNVFNLFSNTISVAYGFDNGYTQNEVMKNGLGYWVRFLGAKLQPVCGQMVAPRTIPVHAGWNIIGPFESDVPVASITSVPSGIVASNYFGYNSFTYGFFSTNNLKVGKGYWVRVSQAGTLHLPNGSATTKLEESETADNSWPQILIEDAGGHTGKLYLLPAGEPEGNFDLPPIPPLGVFDVRFSSDRFAESLEDSRHEIRLSSAQYPIRLQTQNLADTEMQVRDPFNGAIVNETLAAGKEISITAALERLVLTTAAALPTSYALSQNTPNPFNPTTVIKFALPAKARVKISVYNIKGERVAELLNEEKPAGYHQVQFNARGHASGVYFYVMEAGAFRGLKKMLIVK